MFELRQQQLVIPYILFFFGLHLQLAKAHAKSSLCLSLDDNFENSYRKYINVTSNLKNHDIPIQKWNWTDPNSIKKCSNSEKYDLNLTSDGFLIVNDKFYYPQEDFCIEENNRIARICPTHKILWRKCCPAGEMWSMEQGKCRRSPIPYRPLVAEQKQPFQIINDSKSYFTDPLTSGPITCPDGHELKILAPEPCNIVEPKPTSSPVDGESLTFDDDDDCEKSPSYIFRFQLTKEGVLYKSSSGLFHRKSQWKLLHQDAYCVEGFFNNSLCYLIDPVNHILLRECLNSMKDVLFFCDPAGTLVSEDEEQGPEKSYYLASIWLSTCPLLVTAAVSNLLIIQKNVHGWTLTCYLMSMFLVNINSAILALVAKSFGCRVYDFSMKFLYLSTLCWMTSINFGLWKTFRLALPKPVHSIRRFVFNCFFSLVIPGIVVTISYFVGRKETCDNQYCALYSHATIPYYSGPVIFLILVNLGLFIRTSTIISTLRSETSSVLHKESKDNVDSFRLFSKLFLMTGSIWIVRVVLLFLQIKGLYFTWYGVMLESIFSIPEAAFSIMVLLHPEFKKWAWMKYPRFCRNLSQVIPCFQYKQTISLEMGSKSVHSNNTLTQNTSTKSPAISPSSY